MGIKRGFFSRSCLWHHRWSILPPRYLVMFVCCFIQSDLMLLRPCGVRCGWSFTLILVPKLYPNKKFYFQFRFTFRIRFSLASVKLDRIGESAPTLVASWLSLCWKNDRLVGAEEKMVYWCEQHVSYAFSEFWSTDCKESPPWPYLLSIGE